MPVAVYLKHIFGLYNTCFLMISFGEKAKIKKAGNLNEGRSHVIYYNCIRKKGELRLKNCGCSPSPNEEPCKTSDECQLTSFPTKGSGLEESKLVIN